MYAKRLLSFAMMIFYFYSVFDCGSGNTNCFNGFNDIEGHWAHSLIELNAKRGRIAGYEDGSFRPSQSVTRAEFANNGKQILW